MTDTNTPDLIWITSDGGTLCVDTLAQIIREVDGNHTLGASELASRILSHPALAPAREHADALLTTLTKVRDACLVDDPHGLTVETEVTISYELFAEMQDAIDKAKGEG